MSHDTPTEAGVAPVSPLPHIDADTIEAAICRAFVEPDVSCPWNDLEWCRFVTSLSAELARGAGWSLEGY